MMNTFKTINKKMGVIWLASLILFSFNNAIAQIPYNKKVTIKSFNYRTYKIRHQNYKGFISEIKSDLDKRDATFRVVQSLWQSQNGYISLEASNFPGYYLRHQNFRIKLVSKNGNENETFYKDATFMLVPGLAASGWTSFESVNFPGYYLRHKNKELWLEKNDGSELFKKDATWAINPSY